MKTSLRRSAALLFTTSALMLALPMISANARHGQAGTATAAEAVSGAGEQSARRHHRSRSHHAARANRHHGRRVARRATRVVAWQARQRDAQPAAAFGIGGADVVAEARRHIGGNPTGQRSLWCARFMNLVLERTGHRGTGSNLARSFASYGRRISGPQVGAIAVMGRRGGSHVGIISGIDARGNPIIISGNHGHRVAEAAYPRGRVYAYVLPGA